MTEPTVRRVELPALSAPAAPPTVPREEYERRLEALEERARAEGYDVVVVYGDREHAGNMRYLSGFDPRFEEALLLVGAGSDTPRLLVGNECFDYARVAAVPLERVLAQSLSLPGQDRSRAPSMADALREAGVADDQRVGFVGWKDFLPAERTSEDGYLAVPHFVVEAVCAALGRTGSVHDATPLLVDPASGLRMSNSPAQVAEFEYGASLASEHVRRVLADFEPGMTELDASALMGLNGYPLTCHPMVISGREDFVGLRSPSAREIRRGDTLIVAVGLWGGLCARAGLVGESEADGGAAFDGFVSGFVAPYLSAIRRWYESTRVGVTGGDVFAAVADELAHAPFGLLLNPGHATHYEEWTHSQMVPGGDAPLRSGAMLQCDLIPVGDPPFVTCNIEDTVCLADAAFREELFSTYLELADRVRRRRQFLAETIGVEPHEDLLPLSNMPGFLPPLLLRRDECLAFSPEPVAP